MSGTVFESLNLERDRDEIWKMTTADYFYCEDIMYYLYGKSPCLFKDETHQKEYLKSRYGEPEVVKGFILKKDDKIVGWVLYDTFPKKPTQVFIKYLFIDIPYRRMGYGNVIMNAFFDWCRANQKTTISLNYDVKDELLVKFYKRLGFKKDPKCPYGKRHRKIIRNTA